MTGLMKRIFRRRAGDEFPRAGVANLFRGRARGERLPGYRGLPSLGLARLRPRLPWSMPTPAPPPLPPPPAAPAADPMQPTEQIAAPAALAPSFKDRSRLRRRLRFLRRTRELGFRDVGGLIFDMRRFGRNRPDLLDAKLDALLAVDQELRSLERVLDDRRPIHELHEPGISACPRCGALHASEANFCPQCGLQISGPRAMGELGGAIAAPPKPPPTPTAAQQDWSWPIPPAVDQPTAPTLMQPEPDQPTVAHVPAPLRDESEPPPQVRALSAREPHEYVPAQDADEVPVDPAPDEATPSTDAPRAPDADEAPVDAAPGEHAPAAQDALVPAEEPTETKLPREPPAGS